MIISQQRIRRPSQIRVHLNNHISSSSITFSSAYRCPLCRINLNYVVGGRVDGPRRAVAGEEPGERVGAAADLRHERHLWLPGPEGALLLGLLHQRLVAEDGLALVAPDGDDEHAEEDALHHEYDRVQDAGLRI